MDEWKEFRKKMEAHRGKATKRQTLGDETFRALIGETDIDRAKIREELELLNPDDRRRIAKALAERGIRGVLTAQKYLPPQKDKHGCIIGEEEWNDDLHQCVKIVKPAREQIPAQPVVPVGPVTIEQKVAALNDKVAKIEQLLANLYGLVGQNYEETKTALTWHLGKKP